MQKLMTNVLVNLVGRSSKSAYGNAYVESLLFSANVMYKPVVDPGFPKGTMIPIRLGPIVHCTMISTLAFNWSDPWIKTFWLHFYHQIQWIHRQLIVENLEYVNIRMNNLRHRFFFSWWESLYLLHTKELFSSMKMFKRECTQCISKSLKGGC